MDAVPPISLIPNEFWNNVKILTGVLITKLANAFPVNTFFGTVNGSTLIGNPETPEPTPAVNFTDSLGANAFPAKLLAITTTVAPVASEACAITDE